MRSPRLNSYGRVARQKRWPACIELCRLVCVDQVLLMPENWLT